MEKGIPDFDSKDPIYPILTILLILVLSIL